MMKFRGIIRKLDDLGRITIPKEYLDEIGMNASTEVSLVLFEEGLLLRQASFDGTTRKLDNLRRVTMPKRIREHLAIVERDRLEMFLLEEDAVYIKKAKKRG